MRVSKASVNLVCTNRQTGWIGMLYFIGVLNIDWMTSKRGDDEMMLVPKAQKMLET